MLFASSMVAANPDGGGGPEPYRPVQCVSFIQEREAFKRNMKDNLANPRFEYHNVSNTHEQIKEY